MAIISVTVQIWTLVFWVISVYFNIRNTLPKSGIFLLGHLYLSPHTHTLQFAPNIPVVCDTRISLGVHWPRAKSGVRSLGRGTATTRLCRSPSPLYNVHCRFVSRGLNRRSWSWKHSTSVFLHSCDRASLINYFSMKPTDALVSKFILVQNSTCFR